MFSITPLRRTISDRCPVASFVVRSAADRFFEVACATDPRLFHADYQSKRNAGNFYSSRSGGLMRVPNGEATYLLPSQQLEQFAGARRLYYAMGNYGNAGGTDARFTISPQDLNNVPFIRLSTDFTGRRCGMPRLKGFSKEPSKNYGSNTVSLAWGGDSALAEQRKYEQVEAFEYDDGFDDALWKGGTAQSSTKPNNEPDGHEDAPALRAAGNSIPKPGNKQDDCHSYGTQQTDPNGFEDVHTLRTTDLAPQRFGRALLADPHHFTGTIPRQEQQMTYGGPSYASMADYRGSNSESYGSVYPSTGDQNVPISSAMRYGQPTAQPLHTLPDAPATSSAPAPIPLTIDEKFMHIVVPIAGFESGLAPDVLPNPKARAKAYGAINPNNDGAGLSFGIIQFTQRGGKLGTVLEACRRRDETLFNKVFGNESNQLLSATTAKTEEARMAPVAGHNLWDELWQKRFTEAATHVPFQAAQNEVDIEGYVDPNLRVAAWMGFDTDRSLAMLCDRCVQMGNGGGGSWVVQNAGPISNEQEKATALAALGCTNLTAFQQNVEGLTSDGLWGPKTHAAMTHALRSMKDSSPIHVPTREEMLDRLVRNAQAENRAWAHRPESLRADKTVLHDTAYQLD